MPIYEYQCKDCGHKFDKLQKMNDAPLVECPDCHKNELQKLVSAPRFKLKGTGWYETDFKNKKSKAEPKNEASKDTPKADSSREPGTSKSTAKPETTSKSTTSKD